MHKVNWLESLLCAGIWALMVAWPVGAARAAETGFEVPAGQRQLFLDDVGIAKIENLTRTMHKPAKKGAVIRPDLGIGQGTIQFRTGPHWDEQKQVYTLWDCAADPDGLRGATGYYESTDGLHWTKPALGQIEFRGSRANNFVGVEVEGRRRRIDYVVYDPTDPDPSRRYKGWVPIGAEAGHGPIKQPVVSDGLTWKVLDVPPIPSDIHDGNLSFDRARHLFIGGLEVNGPYGRSWAISTSKDFEHWTKPELVFHADARDQELGRRNIAARLADSTMQPLAWNDPTKYNVNVYNMGVFGYESLYIGLPAMFHSTGRNIGFMMVQLTCSRDLKNWVRVGGRKQFIEPSRLGAGAYDLTQILGPGSALVRGDELWFYYTGLKYRGIYRGYTEVPGYDTSSLDRDTGAICLAVLRRDGFISLDAGRKEGTIVTKPFRAPGGRLFVNVDALEGELHVEIMDTSGQVKASSIPIKGDHARAEVKWQRGNIARLKGRAVSLRFTLRNASLYSYWLQ